MWTCQIKDISAFVGLRVAADQHARTSSTAAVSWHCVVGATGDAVLRFDDNNNRYLYYLFIYLYYLSISFIAAQGGEGCGS
jgi:hypothetical protein